MEKILGRQKNNLFPNHHETLERNEREDGKALEKVAADRIVTENLENSRTNCCVNLMGLFFLKMFLLPCELQNECMLLKYFSFTFVKIEQYFRPRPLE